MSWGIWYHSLNGQLTKKIFWYLFLFKCQIFVFSFCIALNLLFEMFHYSACHFCTCHCLWGDIIHRTFSDFFLWSIAKLLQIFPLLMDYITFIQIISDSDTTAASVNKPKHTEIVFYYTWGHDYICLTVLCCCSVTCTLSSQWSFLTCGSCAYGK